MRWRESVVFSLLLLCCVLAAGKKKKVILPADVLQARSVFVIIDPDAGMPIDAPNANRIAQEDVQTAILNWGRFTLAPDIANADLVIEVRRGNGKISGGTIGGLPNNRPMGSRGPGSPSMGDDPESPSYGGNPENPSMGGNPQNPSMGGNPNRAHPQIETGPVEDVMTVYRGRRGDALDTPAVWRYSANNALATPNVPAVDAFRKLIAEAEKQQQQANHP